MQPQDGTLEVRERRGRALLILAASAVLAVPGVAFALNGVWLAWLATAPFIAGVVVGCAQPREPADVAC